MNILRRWRSSRPDGGERQPDDGRRASPSILDLLRRDETGTILVAVGGGRNVRGALEWAAAEATARGSALRIVHTIQWPLHVLDPLVSVSMGLQDTGALEAAGRVLDEAAGRAHAIAPAVPITTHVQAGNARTAILREGCGDDLIVVGRADVGRRFKLTRSVTGAVVSRAGSTVIVVGTPTGAAPTCPGRIVVGVGVPGRTSPALDFAVRAARRQGAALTALHAWMPSGAADFDALAVAVSARHRALEDGLQIYRDAFPDVDIQAQLTLDAVVPALVAASSGAGLLVLHARTRAVLSVRREGSVGRSVVRCVRSPVAFVRSQDDEQRHRGG